MKKWFLMWCVACLMPAKAWAQSPSCEYHGNGWRSGSILSLRVSAFSGLPDLLGASLTVTATHPVELEVGASSALFAGSLYARAGVSVPLSGCRNAKGRGLSLRLPIMAGYRWVQTVPFDTSSTWHAIHALVGIELTYWISAHFGLQARLDLGAMWIVKLIGKPPQLYPIFPDGRLSVGLAF